MDSSMQRSEVSWYADQIMAYLEASSSRWSRLWLFLRPWRQCLHRLLALRSSELCHVRQGHLLLRLRPWLCGIIFWTPALLRGLFGSTVLAGRLGVLLQPLIESQPCLWMSTQLSSLWWSWLRRRNRCLSSMPPWRPSIISARGTSLSRL
jgi:hypothetical protein